VPVELDAAVLYFFAAGAATELAVFMAGWASRNKYSLLAAMRALAQLISYELPLLLSFVPVVMLAGTLSTTEIVTAQGGWTGGWIPHWFVLTPWGFAGFVIFMIAALAESNRSPFDLPEAESELVAGFHTEYSGMKWSFFFMAEYANMVTISAIATTLFFGGWLPPFPNVKWLFFLGWLPPAFWFLAKVTVFLLVYIWLRATFPRYRFDQLMALGWKTLIPLSIGNLVLIALFALWGTAGLQLLGLLLTVTFGGGLFWAFRRKPGPRRSETMAAPAEVRS
jgi:NADH-quinone oxidoreductase subunit H